ncbi:sensor histidine kinase [Pedobacter sp. UC225_65]|uniref:sensor histidine kinase n=1 Tax=Pedobacter sp. UC225_65 TaxID=3350173 RepID=UPI00366EF028
MSKSIRWLKRNRYEFIAWIGFVFYETILMGLLFNQFVNFFIYFAHYTVIVVFFYIHANYTLPYTLKNKTRTIFLLPAIIVVHITLYTLSHRLVDIVLFALDIIKPDSYNKFGSDYILRNIYRGLYFLGFSTGYYYLRNYFKERKKTEELERQRLEGVILQQQTEQALAKAHNAFLKAQINPHFLFNTLDFVYHNVNEQSPVAGETIISLAQMMRYAIDSDKMGEFIELGDEIAQVENLIYLYQIRKNNKLEISLDYTPEVKEVKFIPLILLTLVENIFKHGNLTTEGHEAQITLAIVEDIFYMETENLISRNISKISNNAGIANIENRLRYAYGENLSFTYGQTEDNHFKVSISMPMTALSVHA